MESENSPQETGYNLRRRQLSQPLGVSTGAIPKTTEKQRTRPTISMAEILQERSKILTDIITVTPPHQLEGRLNNLLCNSGSQKNEKERVPGVSQQGLSSPGYQPSLRLPHNMSKTSSFLNNQGVFLWQPSDQPMTPNRNVNLGMDYTVPPPTYAPLSQEQQKVVNAKSREFNNRNISNNQNQNIIYYVILRTIWLIYLVKFCIV